MGFRAIPVQTGDPIPAGWISFNQAHGRWAKVIVPIRALEGTIYAAPDENARPIVSKQVLPVLPEGYEFFMPQPGDPVEGVLRARKDVNGEWSPVSLVKGDFFGAFRHSQDLDFWYVRPVASTTSNSLAPKGDAGSKKAPLWLLPPVALEVASWAHKHGADKYGLFNWRENKVCASTYISAMMRHLNAWRDGEDNDLGSGVSHLAHVIASANILLDATHCRNLKDDRIKLPSLSPQCPD